MHEGTEVVSKTDRSLGHRATPQYWRQHLSKMRDRGPSATYPTCGVASTFDRVRKGCRADKGSSSNTSSATPAIERDCRALISDASSTIGPREVVISRAVGFMSASSAAPTRPLVRLLKITWIVTTSACLNNSIVAMGTAGLTVVNSVP